MAELDPHTGLPAAKKRPRRDSHSISSILSRLNRRRIAFLFLGLVVLGRYILSGLGLSESDRVLQVIDRAVEAVEKKSFFTFQSVISPRYRDRSGLDRGMILQLAARYFHGTDSVRIYPIQRSVEFPTEDRAIVHLRIQAIGRSGGTLTHGLAEDSLLGEKYTIFLARENGRWKITAVDPENRNWPRP